MHFPSSMFEWCCVVPSVQVPLFRQFIVLTFFRTFEDHIKLLHVVVDQCYLVVTHHELHDVRLDPSLRTTHLATPTSVLSFISGDA